ncbi:MAG: outer membrane beta-barrel protein [Prolixibacteraceae bacterium]|jgi:outer membrane receptor for ferrienterochelin and colicin|nr:outer membrane beta-barrel protein [Prolixibacteraceae bacterium]
MSRIFWGFTLLFLFLVPLPGLNFLHKISHAIDKSALIKGKVIDAETKATIEYANISLFHRPDTIPIQVTATNEKGEFIFRNLHAGSYTVSVHFMGFKDFISQIIILSPKSGEYSIEPIPLEIQSQSIKEVSIQSNAGKPVYQLDKRTIYVENQMSGTGGTAYDLLFKLPSVTQKPDGQLAIHGNSNLLVFINGKPSSMKGSDLLEYTSASEVKRIELITSPSAKYDASGSGGIINLITKKNSLDGFNGNVMASTDHLGGYTSDLLLNYKRSKISLFAGFDHNRRKNEGEVDYVTRYLTDQTLFAQTGSQQSARKNTAFRTGFDYHPSNGDKLSFTGHTGTFETTNYGDWNTVKSNGTAYAGDIRNHAVDKNDRKGTYSGADVSFEHKFRKPGKSISISALWNNLNYDDHYLNLSNDVSGAETMKQTTRLDKKFNNFQFNADFVSPTGKAGNLEAGTQISFNKEQEGYQSELSNPSPPGLTIQESHFNGMIGAAYSTWQFKIKRLDLKAGLRAEYLNREMKTLYGSFPLQQFKLYPSLNSSFKIDSTQEILLNYTRRTDQLKTIQLDPLPRWYNFHNVMMGNPDLKNEITDKITLDYLLNFGKLTIINELYFYNTSNKIEVIQSIYHDQILQNRNENMGSEKTFGLEINAIWSATNWMRLSEKFDFIDTNLDVKLVQIANQRRYQQGYSVTTADFTISPTLLIQFDFAYFGPAMTAQSNIDQIYMAGLTVRKSFLDRKLTVTISGRDIPGLYKKVEHVGGAGFNEVMTMQNKFPVHFSVSYKFNHYSRDERRVAKYPVAE